jgi:hypothetical protein
MKRQRLLLFLLILGLVISWQGNIAQALPLVPGTPPGTGWLEQTGTTPCTHTYYTIDTSTHRDYTLAERMLTLDAFEARWGANVYVPIFLQPSSSIAYNCHAYALIGSGGWLLDPYPFENVTPNGPICRFSSHTAFATYGSSYLYIGKCGTGPIAYHNHVLYGFHYQQWCPK